MRNLLRVFTTILAAGLLLALSTGCSAKAKMARHLQQADKHFAAGQYLNAEIEYLNVLHFDPLNARAIGRLGVVYYEEGRYSQAYPVLLKACELTPNDLDLHLKLGTIYLSGKKPEEARAEANLILDKAPSHAEATVLLASSVKTRKDSDEVRSRLQKLSAQVGDTAALQLAFGLLSYHRGDRKAAETAFKRAQTLDPKSSAAPYALGILYLSQNDRKGAELALKTAAELAPVRSERRLKYAEFKIQNGDLDAGKRLLEEVAKLAHDYVPAGVLQTEIALAEKKYDDCDTLLNRVIALDSDNPEALLLKGRLLMARGDAVKAIAEFERMIPRYEGIPQVHYHLAVAHLLDNNDTTKALKSLRQALVLDPGFVDALLLQARLDILRDDAASAITTLTELIKRRPQLAQAQLLLADANRAKGDLAAALAILLRLEESLPKNPELPVMIGVVYARQNQKAEARKAFNRALELSPGYLLPLEDLVNLDIFDEQYAAASARVEKEIERNARAAEPQLLLAKVYIAQAENQANKELKDETVKNPKLAEPRLRFTKLLAAQPAVNQAEKALLKAIELNPKLHEAYFVLARLYHDTEQSQKALARLDETLAKDPKDIKALMLSGMIQEEVKNFPAARAAYERLMTINPRFYLALNNLAYLYSEKFDLPDKAFEMARKARDLLSYKAKAGENEAESGARTTTEFLRAFSSDTLGWIVFKRGDYSYALSLLQESAEKLSNSPEVQFHLGMACYMLGQEERAQNALKRALSFDKDFPGKEEAGRRLTLLAVDPKTADRPMIASLEKQLQDQPDDPVVLARLAAVYGRDKTPEKIVKAYEAAYEAASKRNAKSLPVLLKLAVLYSASSQTQPRALDLPKALDLAKEAYKLAPENPEVCRLLGHLVLEKGGDPKWALSLLQKGAANQAPEPEALYDLALAYYSVGRVSDAEAGMRNALQTDRSFSRADQARRFLELVPLSSDPVKALAAEPKVREILKSNADDVPALMVLAACSQQRGDAQAARLAYERVFTRYPDFAPATKHLAALYADLGDTQKAYDLAVKAREAFPNDAEVARTLGIILYLRKDYPSSVRLLDESVHKGSEDGRALYYAGLAHYQLFKGQKTQIKAQEQAESKKALQRALALNLQPNLAADAKRILALLN